MAHLEAGRKIKNAGDVTPAARDTSPVPRWPGRRALGSGRAKAGPMSTSRPFLHLLCALLAAASLAACGGAEDDDAIGAPPAPSDEQSETADDALRPRLPIANRVQCALPSLSYMVDGKLCEPAACDTGICPAGTTPTCTYGYCYTNRRGLFLVMDNSCNCL